VLISINEINRILSTDECCNVKKCKSRLNSIYVSWRIAQTKHNVESELPQGVTYHYVNLSTDVHFPSNMRTFRHLCPKRQHSTQNHKKNSLQV
ncbi:hypothetical protein, partial [Vibrio splendidus]|uniref:hypothetical protein n=1 Tax=Vibrio splendidus TaxID=29497 RepID=UPI001C62A1BE